MTGKLMDSLIRLGVRNPTQNCNRYYLRNG